ncbi:increased loss of mitochondrial DNA protein 1 [Podospora australis]|uniref:Increased loss of mitochondrial DNA protein 1 n=1 Tax=Podospora australis TaxID=1536484 RepID=A0AAN6X1K0_9PEZI|nr:increased loss of mitochondrial DNA protein 1 [Podospora australis]
MALISAKTIITSLSLFHLTLAFFFLTNPSTIADQSIVYLLGDSMGLPHSRSFETQSPALAFLAVILAFVGISDLVSLSYPDEICLVYHWGTQAPLRVTLSFFLTLYSFFFSPSSPLFYHDESSSSSTTLRFTHHPNVYAAAQNPNYVPSNWGGDALKNRVFFTFMFVETFSWFWIWATLGEEQKEILNKKARRRSASHSYDF